MSLYKDANNNLYDDMGGTAQALPIWPKDAVPVTDEEAEQIRSDQQAAMQMAQPQMQSMVEDAVIQDPVQKLVAYLNANPDVKALLQ